MNIDLYHIYINGTYKTTALLLRSAAEDYAAKVREEDPTADVEIIHEIDHKYHYSF